MNGSRSNQRFKSFALGLPDRFAFYPTRLADQQSILELIGELHPVHSASSPLIRLGGDSDGGYLVPDDLGGIHACFSPGVDQSSVFEVDCANRGMQVFMADASVDGPAASHPAFHFAKKYIGGFTKGEFISMEDWIHSSSPESDQDLMLQMDIEGYEYEALLSMSSALISRFRIMVIEFHKLDSLFSEALNAFTAGCLRKILLTHACVHIHPNNVAPAVERSGVTIPRACEFTFLRRDRLKDPQAATRFPHPLDRDCCPEYPHQTLPRCWHA